MITVATRYGVSASYLARVCECLDVPRPPRGYWAKLQFGRSTEKPKLPVAPPGRETEWTPGRSPGLYTASRVLKLPSHPDASADASLNPPATHFLLKDVQAHYDAAKVSDDGYLRPNKRLLVDVYVSKDMLARALEVANALFRELERARHPVTFASSHEHAHRPELDQREKPGPYPLWQTWRPARPTVTFVDTVAFGLTLYEISEEVEVRYLHGKYVRTDAVPPRGGYRGGDGWTTKKDMPTGRLDLACLFGEPARQVGNALEGIQGGRSVAQVQDDQARTESRRPRHHQAHRRQHASGGDRTSEMEGATR